MPPMNLFTDQKPVPMKDVYHQDDLMLFMKNHYGFDFSDSLRYMKGILLFVKQDMMQDIKDPHQRLFYEILCSTIGNQFMIWH